MRGFLVRVAIFFLPLLLGGILLFILPFDPVYAYANIEKHCRNGNWIQHQLNHSTENIDIALIGTSRTMCAVSDYLLEEVLEDSGAVDLRVANLGFARPGRSLHYAFTKTLLAHHQPNVLILEVQSRESKNSHLDFPYIADAADVISAKMFMNTDYMSDVFTAAKVRFLYWRGKLLGEQLSIDSEDVLRSHSFIPGGPLLNIDDSYLDPIPFRPTPTGLEATFHTIQYSYPHHYLRRIKEMCAQQGVALRFLYLPNFNDDQAQLPLDLNMFETWAPVWIPPDDIIHTVGNYMDPDHLNETGAAQLSAWLAKQIDLDPEL